MWCLVVLPNSVVLEINVDSKSEGQECLDKVCERLGVIETDYFGLQYVGSKGEELWLNMRNGISRQLPGSAPYRMQLRVKFFVQPHFLLQEVTRHLFFLQVKEQFQNDGLHIPDFDQLAKISSLIVQAEHGDCTCTTQTKNQVTHQLCACEFNPYVPNGTQLTKDLHTAIVHNHCQLLGLPKASAEYRMLQEVSSLNYYGVELHKVWNSASELFHMGVGPEGIALYDKEWNVRKRIAYPTVQMATHASKCVFLHTLQDDGKCVILGFKLVTPKAANGLYRCVTEMHSFYRCDTVRNAVAAQFSRDLKGTLASLFNENTTLGKKYVFDIKRTCREAYDHARRKLYSQGQPTTPIPPPITPTDQDDMECSKGHSDSAVCNSKCQKLREHLERIQDEFLCRVCMDADIDTAFCPCGHLVTCSSCAERLESCPMCRSPITQTQHIFLPKVKVAATSVSSSRDPADDGSEDVDNAIATSDHQSMETFT